MEINNVQAQNAESDRQLSADGELVLPRLERNPEFIVPAEVRGAILSKRKEITAAQTKLNILEKETKKLEQSFDELSEQRGFRERYLPRWLCKFFGGDVELVDKRRETEVKIEEAMNQIEADSEEISHKEDTLEQTITNHLLKVDSRFQALDQKRRQVEEVISETEEYLSVIDDALSEVNDAETMETFDLFSKNKGISFLSTIENGEASDAIEIVEEAGPKFKRAVEKYMKQVAPDGVELSGEVGLGDTMDLILDLGFDGFDFMSIFTLSSLHDADYELSELSDKVGEALELFEKHQDAIDACKKEWCAAIERACSDD